MYICLEYLTPGPMWDPSVKENSHIYRYRPGVVEIYVNRRGRAGQKDGTGLIWKNSTEEQYHCETRPYLWAMATACWKMTHAAMHGMFAEKIVHCFYLNVWWIVETSMHSPWNSSMFSLGI